jgi:DMSO/TMAO reductase YedYZ molybdopterin-dependent catalytic subunit
VQTDPTRRDFLKTVAAFALTGLAQDEELVDFADLSGFSVENHAATPRAKFFDLRRLISFNTPEDEFFTFHQTVTPLIQAEQWRLRVSGFVERPAEFTLDEIKGRSDKRDLAVTIECSGNTPYGAANGQISTGTWTGVGLASLLRECAVKPEAREVVFFGADKERERGDAPEFPHGRSIYVQDAMESNVMLAYGLNGKPLPPDRGFPLRLLVPGWYGMTQIKWLTHIEVLDRRYEGAHMARNYHSIRDQNALIETSISKTRLKSVVARVTRRKDATGRIAYRISGAAWGGTSSLKAVEVKVDGNAWRAATLGERHGDFAWTLWTFDWTDAAAGPHTLVSRAIDVANNVQPSEAEWQQTIKTLRENNSQWLRRIVL